MQRKPWVTTWNRLLPMKASSSEICFCKEVVIEILLLNVSSRSFFFKISPNIDFRGSQQDFVPQPLLFDLYHEAMSAISTNELLSVHIKSPALLLFQKPP